MSCTEPSVDEYDSHLFGFFTSYPHVALLNGRKALENNTNFNQKNFWWDKLYVGNVSSSKNSKPDSTTTRVCEFWKLLI